jgi:hypothetical protein
MKEEFQEMQKSQKGMTSSATNLQNLDLAEGFASWMAGSKKDEPAVPKVEASKSKK